MRNIILSPHLDDAVLSLGGLLAKEGSDSAVVTVFAGRPEKRRHTAWDLLCGFRNSDMAMDAREKENHRAMDTLNVAPANIIDLPYPDSQYRREEVSAENLAEALSAAIAPLLSPECRLYGPSKERHPDHLLVKQAFVTLAKTLSVPCFYYDDLPYAADSGPSDAGEPVVIPLTEEQMRMKIEAVSCYASQILPLSYAGGLRGRIRKFAASRAQASGSEAPYAEVVYALG